MARLCVNVDHVATLRQARGVDYPDPLEAALLAEAAGCVGITVHLREDRRHIQDHDVARIKKRISTKLNLEMAAAPEIVEIAMKTRPWQVTFVPEKRKELTTEGGLNLTRNQKKLGLIIEGFKRKKIVVSLFIDPEEDATRRALELGADAVEFNTGRYCEAPNKKEQAHELAKVRSASALAARLGLTPHAGHGLNLDNVGPIASIAEIEELNIGHSIVTRAVMVGFAAAVEEMIEAMEKGR
ncbi:MAG: pyridoxine 5'-phosphate synthase [Nitrospinota bacterium]|nr:pyridoxine 5'-phosphate synthase [Nitrospinota bacterium]MDH5677698.1 pyridoxine 5'-phosphate synthase [Nitrospinota bacterium]MDH5755462.1 pyridoxine 5'-phosphate synthase [Nitrospinota bacterium]